MEGIVKSRAHLSGFARSRMVGMAAAGRPGLRPPSVTRSLNWFEAYSDVCGRQVEQFPLTEMGAKMGREDGRPDLRCVAVCKFS